VPRLHSQSGEDTPSPYLTPSLASGEDDAIFFTIHTVNETKLLS